jgi:hypothetical protein
MASPYFQQIRVQQPDFSPITRGAEAYGRGIGEAFRSIGKIGGMYFQEKGYEQQVADFMQTEMGQEMMQQAGLKIDQDNPKETLKHAKGLINSFGGFQEFQNAIQADMQAERAQEVAKQQDYLFKKQKVQIDQQIEEKEYLLDRLNIEQELGEKKNSYFQHLNKKNENGVRLIDTDDPTAGFDASNPVALQAVMSVNQELGLGVHNPAIIGMLSDSVAPVDNITGEQLPYANFTSEADMFNKLDQVFLTEIGRRLPPEQRAALVERMKANIDGAGGKKTVRELFKQEVESSGFGAFAEAMKTNTGTMGNFRELLDESLVTLDDGTVDIKNPVAASVALMQLARMAQGAGVLSNQDVNLIKGDQTLAASWERLISKNIGETTELTDDMIKQNPAWQNSLNPDTGEVFQAGDEVTLGGANLSAADMKMFQSLANKLDDRSNQFIQKVIPDIYKNVKATYGGFTTGQLNQFTDLHQYMPNGLVNLNPLSTVRQKDMQGIYYMMNHEQMTPEETYSTIRNISIQKGVWDEDTDGPATRAAISEITKGGYRPRQNQQAIDYQQYKGKGRRVQKNIDKTIIEPDNLEASGNAVKNVMFGAGGTGTGMAAVDMGKGMLDKSRIKKESFPFKKQALNRVKDLSGNELRTVAKDVGVKSSDKMTDTVLRKQVTNKIKQEVKEEVANKLAAMGAKKKVFSALTKLMTSGTVGSVMFVMDLVQADNLPRDAKLSALKDAVNKAKKGSPEREIAQEMFDRAYYSDPRNVRPEEKFMGIKQRKLRHSVELYGL